MPTWISIFSSLHSGSFRTTLSDPKEKLRCTAQIPRTKIDPVEADSRHYTVELENEKVRVVRIKHGAREKSVMHSHPLNDCKAKFTYPNVKSEEIAAKAAKAGK